MELKDQIRIAREAMGLSIEQLARELEVSRAAIYYWEDGENAPKNNHLRLLEKVLKVRFDTTGIGDAIPFDKVNLNPSLKPEVVRLAVAISRLPRAQRDAIETLAFMGEKQALRSEKESGSDKAEDKLPLFPEHAAAAVPARRPAAAPAKSAQARQKSKVM